MTTTPLTAIRQPDGTMYLQEENPHYLFKNQTEEDEENLHEAVSNLRYNKWEEAHPPVIALFKCEEGQTFVEGVDIRKVTQYEGNRVWIEIEDGTMLEYYKRTGIPTHQAFELIKSERGDGEQKDRELPPLIQHLADAIAEKGLKVTFGLQPDHIVIIEDTIKELGFVNEYVFDMIGKKIGWAGYTVACYYIKYLQTLNPNNQ